ncbi:MAG: DUF533 domain-containing protein [Alphaproteobacteria bacterium]|nr:DUF533 domain-containing protein [Alphaproteobacteria bacterium]
MDLGKVFGALLGGAATPPRRRAAPTRGRGTGPFGMTQAQTRDVGRVLGTLAGVAVEALKTRPAPAPAPVPKGGGVRPASRVPETGADPWQAKPGAPPAAPKDETAETAEALLITRTMVAAARADGVTDAAERAAIAQQLDAAGLTAADRDRVLADFDAPLSPEALAKQAGDPMLRAQLYAAAVAAMGEISAPEREWLARFGTALKLDASAREAIERRLS